MGKIYSYLATQHVGSEYFLPANYIVPEEAKTRPKRAVLCIEIIVSAKMERIHFPALQQWVTIYNVAIENTGFTWGDSIFIFARK